MRSAKETAGRGGGGRAHLDYGIDGPLTGDVGINIELDQGAGQTATGTVVSMEAAPDINASLPYFMQQPGSAGAGTGQVWASQRAQIVPSVLSRILSALYSSWAYAC